MLPHLGAGMFFVQGRTPADMGGRLVAEVADEDALRREATALAQRLGPKRAELHHGPGGGAVLRPVRQRPRHPVPRADRATAACPSTSASRPGGVAEDLDDTRAYRDAAARLGGAPTFLLIDEGGYLAARDAVEDGRRVVRYVSVQQRG